MKVFVVLITYRKPVEEIRETVIRHRQFLQGGYQRGWLLFSGPQEDRTGGVILARAPSRTELEDFFKNDPYQLEGVADHRFIPFNPVLSQDFIKPWIAGE
jgi:uncharacterized protein YciI